MFLDDGGVEGEEEEEEEVWLLNFYGGVGMDDDFSVFGIVGIDFEDVCWV